MSEIDIVNDQKHQKLDSLVNDRTMYAKGFDSPTHVRSFHVDGDTSPGTQTNNLQI